MEWTMFDRGMVLLAMTTGWVVAIGLHYLFTRKTRIYWTPAEGQIKTRGGKCLYDRDKAREDNERWKEECNEAIHRNAVRWGDLQRQLQCSVKGHGKWVFQESLKGHPSLTLPILVFTCPDCGLEVSYTKEELDPVKVEALKKLGVIEKGK